MAEHTCAIGTGGIGTTQARCPECQRIARAEAQANVAYTQALWYAWGWKDSGSIPCTECGFTREAHSEDSEERMPRGHRYQMPKIEAFEFAESVKANTLAYHLGETFFLESIQGQWEKYVASKIS